MKNFIVVINKEKIYAYVLSICTIITLFFMSNFIKNDFDEVELTSSNVTNNIIINENVNDIIFNEENNLDSVIE